MEPQGDPNRAPAALRNTSSRSLPLYKMISIYLLQLIIIIGFYLNVMGNYILSEYGSV